jgi:hypothetical protein
LIFEEKKKIKKEVQAFLTQLYQQVRMCVKCYFLSSWKSYESSGIAWPAAFQPITATLADVDLEVQMGAIGPACVARQCDALPG